MEISSRMPLILIIGLILSLIPVNRVTADSATSSINTNHTTETNQFVTGEIVWVAPLRADDVDSFVTNVKVKILNGKLAGRIYKSSVPNDPPYAMTVKQHDRVMVVVDSSGTEPVIGIDDYYRISGVIPIIIIAILPVILLGGKKGLTSIAALAITILIVLGVMTNLLLKGFPPVFTSIVTSAVVTILTLLLISGRGKKSLVAITGTLGGLCFAALLAWVSACVLHLSGLAGHESIFLQGLNLNLDFKGLLLCGMIIGALGAVMDVCMSIASSLEEIALTDPEVSPGSLLRSGFKIGSDMLGTMTNTLVLAYTGSSLTLILLIVAQGAEFPLIRIMNMEFIGVEIVRSVSGLFGMAMAIPLSALIASILFTKPRTSMKEPGSHNQKNHI
jgi:uncharacterized membrane protein